MEIVENVARPRTPSVLLAIAVPVVFGILCGGVLSLLFGRANHPGTKWTRRAVLDGLKNPPVA